MRSPGRARVNASAMTTLFQNVTRGSLLRGSGLLVIGTGSLGVHTEWGMFGFVLRGIPLWCFGVAAAVGGVMFFLGPMLYGASSVTPDAATPDEPGRMLFLYLRPFELDMRSVVQLLVGASAGILVYLDLLGDLWVPVAVLPVLLNISKEQRFREALLPLGDFIAFGRPGERLQPVGASRLYRESGWKAEITRYMEQARLVIVRPGSSPSIRWEVSQVLRTVPPERRVFYLRSSGWGKRKERDYQAFRRCVRAHLGVELPERLGEARYLVFDAAGQPRFIREASRPSELVRQFLSRSGDIATDWLHPVLHATGLEPFRRPNTALDKVTHVIVWLGALFSITVLGVAVAWLLFVLAFIPVVLFLRLALAV